MLALLDKVSSNRGEVAARIISVAVAVVACATAIWASWYWVALLAAWAAVSSSGRLLQRRAESRDEPLWSRLEDAWKQLKSGELEQGMVETREVLLSAKSDRLRAAAAEQLAWEWLLAGDVERAEAQLRMAPASYRPSQLIRGAIALRGGDAKEAVKLLEEVVAKEPEVASVHFLIEAYIAAGRLDDAVACLEGNELAGELLSLTVSLVVDSLRDAGRIEEADRLAMTRQ